MKFRDNFSPKRVSCELLPENIKKATNRPLEKAIVLELAIDYIKQLQDGKGKFVFLSDKIVGVRVHPLKLQIRQLRAHLKVRNTPQSPQNTRFHVQDVLTLPNYVTFAWISQCV